MNKREIVNKFLQKNLKKSDSKGVFGKDDKMEMAKWFNDNFKKQYEGLVVIFSKFFNVQKNKWTDLFAHRERYYFIKALTHESYFSDSKQYKYYFSYQRAEFLGDARINLFIKRWVFYNYRNYNQHIYSIISNHIKSTNFLSNFFDILGLEKVVLINEELSPRIKGSMVESFFEAFYSVFGKKMSDTLFNKLMKNFNKNKLLYDSISLRCIVNELVNEKFSGVRNKKNIVQYKIKYNEKYKNFFCVGFIINKKYFKNNLRVNACKKGELIEMITPQVIEQLYIMSDTH